MNKNPSEVMKELHQKFNGNFSDWNSLPDPGLEKSFTCLFSIAAIGEILEGHKSSTHHDVCCMIYDEIFSDGVSSIYLATNAMDKPAKKILRRILELGIAAIYLWDMPHKTFSWQNYDQDLSFTEMLNHINSKGYISYVEKENSTSIASELFPSKRSQSIYGSLSDIVHGKITTFESALPERYKFIKEEWDQFIELFEEVVCMLTKAFILRFNIEQEVFTKVPQAKKELF